MTKQLRGGLLVEVPGASLNQPAPQPEQAACKPLSQKEAAEYAAYLKKCPESRLRSLYGAAGPERAALIADEADRRGIDLQSLTQD